MTAKVLVSACLLGKPVRYDGHAKPQNHQILERWREQGRVVSVCPEVAGGLPVPRPPAEMRGGDGSAVWMQSASVLTAAGVDVTAEFVAGARFAASLVKREAIQVAMLKERSPSCGSRQVYDGGFDGSLVEGQGVTAALLTLLGVEVFGESQFEEADRRLCELDGEAGQTGT